jgi:hypothetical protein
MAACYRLHTAVEFYAKFVGSVAGFLPHVSSDNLLGKRSSGATSNDGIFSSSSDHRRGKLISIYVCPDITMLMLIRVFYVVGAKFCYLRTSDKWQTW